MGVGRGFRPIVYNICAYLLYHNTTNLKQRNLCNKVNTAFLQQICDMIDIT